MKIVSYKICPFVQRVTALLEAKNISYDVEYIDLSNKPDWFLGASPHGQVPILYTEDGCVLFESDAIVEYIEEVTEIPLFPSEPVEKAKDRAWAYLASKNYVLQCSMQRSADAKTLRERAKKLNTAFAKIEPNLGDSSFVRGKNIGMVDIAWLPMLHRASIIEAYSGYDLLEHFPRIKEWQKAILETGLAEKSVADDFEERFTAFYLAESTYLGQITRYKNEQRCETDSPCVVDSRSCCG